MKEKHSKDPNLSESTSKFASTAQEEAEKINAQTGAGFVTDPEFWAKQGIFTGEELAISVLNQTYSDLHKELRGVRPKHPSFKTVEEAEQAIDALDDEYVASMEMQQLDMKAQAAYEAEREELASLMPGEFDDFERQASRSGMGRRMENVEKEKLRLTVGDLEKIISEAIDGHPYDGPIESWADIASSKWAGGSVVNPQQWKDNCKLGGQFTVGKAPSILTPGKKKMTETQLRDTIRKVLKEEMNDSTPFGSGLEPVEGLDSDEKDIIGHT